MNGSGASSWIILIMTVLIIIGIIKIIFHITTIFAIIPIILLIFLILGIGLILAVCNTYFSDIGHLYNVFALILMYASALFYPIEIVPAKVQIVFTLNPLYSAITCFREAVVYGVIPDLGTIAYLATFSIAALGIGIILFNIYEKKLALEI